DLGGLGERSRVVGLLRELKQGLGVRETTVELFELLDLGFEPRLFLGGDAGLVVVGPEFGGLRKVVQLFDAALFDRKVKATPGGDRPAPSSRRGGCGVRWA
ncbi:MAG TPA: hypothetical protein VL588_00050, partial [Bdellovibrionota bacterium]|nr:hypothetical protein [Bdellovibrionota bacterium]